MTVRGTTRSPGSSQDPNVARHHVEEVQELALVLVNALDLHVEQRIDSDLHAGAPPHLLGEPQLVGALDAAEMAAKFRILRRSDQPSDLLEIVLPGGAETLA